jgi:hypothetical protein
MARLIKEPSLAHRGNFAGNVGVVNGDVHPRSSVISPHILEDMAHASMAIDHKSNRKSPVTCHRYGSKKKRARLSSISFEAPRECGMIRRQAVALWCGDVLPRFDGGRLVAEGRAAPLPSALRTLLIIIDHWMVSWPRNSGAIVNSCECYRTRTVTDPARQRPIVHSSWHGEEPRQETAWSLAQVIVSSIKFCIVNLRCRPTVEDACPGSVAWE